MSRNFVIDVLIKGRDLLSGPLGTAGAKISKFGLNAGTGARKLAGALGNTRNLIVGAAAALGAKRAWDGLNEWSEGADRVGKSAFRLGIAAQELQQWQRAAEMADVPASKFSAAMGKMSDNLGRARAGQGQLYNDLKRVAPGLLEQALKTKNNAEALDLFARALDQTSDAAERESLARMVFGRGGGDMIAMLKDGYPALKELLEEMTGYGLVTNQTARDAEEFNDAQMRLKYSIAGVKNELGSRLLPLLTPYILRLKDWISVNRGLIATRLEEFLRRTYERLRPVGRWLRDNKDGLFGAFSSGAEIIGNLLSATGTLLSTLGKFPAIAKLAAGGFIAAMVLMNSNPQFVALMAPIMALQAALKFLEKRSVDSQTAYINDTAPDAQVFRTPEERDKWLADQDARRQPATQSYAPGSEPVANALDSTLNTGGSMKFSLSNVPGGVIEVPVSIMVDETKMPDWLGAKPHVRKAKVGVRTEAWIQPRTSRW
jgi:tetratricopeptide (TPR) repeat protein